MLVHTSMISSIEHGQYACMFSILIRVVLLHTLVLQTLFIGSLNCLHHLPSFSCHLAPCNLSYSPSRPDTWCLGQNSLCQLFISCKVVEKIHFSKVGFAKNFHSPLGNFNITSRYCEPLPTPACALILDPGVALLLKHPQSVFGVLPLDCITTTRKDISQSRDNLEGSFHSPSTPPFHNCVFLSENFEKG